MPLTVAAALIAEAVPRTTALAPLIAAALAPVASPLRVRATKCAPASPAAMTTAPGTGGAIAVDLAIATATRILADGEVGLLPLGSLAFLARKGGANQASMHGPVVIEIGRAHV